MPTTHTVAHSWQFSNKVRVAAAALCGSAAGILAAVFRFPVLPVLVGWDVFALTYIAWVSLTAYRLHRDTTAGLAASEDPDRLAIDVLMLLACLASLGGVGWGLVQAGKSHGEVEFIHVVAAILSVVLSWALVHTIFTLRYARLYYRTPKGGIDFNSDEDPTYSDFAYFAYTIGMTFQVSDTSITSTLIRRAALRHALLSYLFGTVIVATTINLVAGLSK
jgi:uncharacterized membrane protein